MGEYAVGLVWALGLGLATSVAPCPLATNIAAISYISRDLRNTRRVLLTGLLYAVGRTAAYLCLGALIVGGLLAKEEVSSFLSDHINAVLGPILILVAMLLLEMIRIGVPGVGMSDRLKQRVDALGIWGALVLGMLFALAFCPTSAGFFLWLVTEAIKVESRVGMPAVYGIGTAVPVVAFALVLAFSAQSVGKVFNRVTQIEWWVRRITGILFLALGFYFTLVHIFDLTVLRTEYGLEVSLRLWW